MITQKTSQDEIEKMIQEHIERIEKAIIEILSNLGDQCVNEARTGYTYTPRTRNLLHSVGYHVIKDGVFVCGSHFEEDEGGQTGKTFIESLYSKFPKGILLLVVAGMDYAAAVEARNFNVLTSAELFAEMELPKLMDDLGFELTRK